tara:strand:- start:1419 stop:1811 length:393 start_codon:yes stop_codon:yes gene_type:complete
MKSLNIFVLLLSTIAINLSVSGQSSLEVKSKSDMISLELDGLYGTDDYSYSVDLSTTDNFFDFYFEEMMGERTMMSCSGIGNLINGKLVVTEPDDMCWGTVTISFIKIEDDIFLVFVDEADKIYMHKKFE